MNAFVNVLRFLNDIKLAMLPIACNFLVALLEREKTFSSKLSSESIVIPSKVSFVPVLIKALPVDTSIGVVEPKSK